MFFNKVYHTVFLGIGSNVGDRKKNIQNALAILRKTNVIKLRKISKIYQTNPKGCPSKTRFASEARRARLAKGGPPQRRFLNGAIKIETTLTPLQLLKTLKKIEKQLGRKKTVRFGPRVIDLDILLYGKMRIKKKNLIIPHPRMHERSFVLKPLKEII